MLLLFPFWFSEYISRTHAQERHFGELEIGKPIEREMAGGQIHRYQLMLTEGQYLHLVVEQKGIDVVAVVFDPEGKEIFKIDSPNGTQGTEIAYLIAKSSGSYRLEVRALGKSSAPGQYQAKIEALRIATPQDKIRIAWNGAFAEGARRMAQATAESLRAAIVQYQEALNHLQSANEPGLEARTLSSLGNVYYQLREVKKALDAFLRELPLNRAIGDRDGEAVALVNIGRAYRYLGENQKALDYYNQSLQLRRAMGDRKGEDVALNNIGVVYFTLGERQKALDYLNRSLQLRREAGDRNGEAATLVNLGRVYASSEEKQKALSYYNQSLSILRAEGNRSDEALVLNNLGSLFYYLGEKQKALETFGQSLRLKRDVGDLQGQAILLNNMGGVYIELGEWQKAMELLDQSLRLSQTVSDRGSEAPARYHLARVERQRGHLIEARSQIETTLAIVESFRAKVDIQELRASYVASVPHFYEFYIDLLAQMHQQDPSAGHDAAAFEACERARARSLLETLADARADIRQGVDPQLLERERVLQQQLNAKASAQTALLNGKQTARQAEAIAKQIEDFTTQLREVKAKIRTSSPRYDTLTQPQLLKVSDIQQQVLDQDTLLLEYFLGQKQSYLWAVSSTSISLYQLPSRAEIKEAAIEVYKLLTARGHGPGNTQAEWRARVVEADSKYWSQAARLSRMLLGPVASQLGPLGKKRLLIVADGALHYIPFAALPAPSVADGEDQKSEADPQPLIVEHEIVSLPSASTLAALRRETAGRQRGEKSLAVLADPVFAEDDSRVRRNKTNSSEKARAPSVDSDDTDAAHQQVTRAGQETGTIGAGARFGRLLNTRHEAASILALVPARERKQALDFEASRATALSPELSKYRIVHFATHGLLNSIHPELSGIVLSLVDEHGQSQNGFLRLHEIYNLKLPAELVVLSACHTGLGKEVKAEGLIGLTRGFMYAGTPRVVATLWKVDDKATSELMKRFYQGLLGPERLRPAEGLREAQLSIWKQKQWRAPYYWAAFVLQGEWR